MGKTPISLHEIGVFPHFPRRKHPMTASRSLIMFSRFVPAICLAALVGFAFRLFHFVYFWVDDFNNLFWVQQTSASALLLHVADPGSQFFRPVGMVLYWTLLQCCDLDPAAYHGVAWSLHVVNVLLVYLIVLHFVRSPYAAAAGAAL